MRRRGPGDGVVTVELLEEDAALASPTGPDDAADPADAARARRLRLVGLAVVVALLGTILTATVIEARRDAARRAALAELDWVLPSFEGPLEEVWRTSGGWVMATTAQVIVVQDSMEGAMRALDAATGSLLWERAATGSSEYCQAMHDYQTTDQDPYLASTLVCGPNGWGDGLPEVGATDDIVAVDTATGAELRSLVIDGKVLSQNIVDEDILVSFVDAQGAIGVIRWDPGAGEEWSYLSAPGVLPDGVSLMDVWVDELREDVLRLTDELALDVDTGLEVAAVATDPEPSFNGNVQVLADGGRLEWLWDDGSSGYATPVRVLNADGSLRFEVEGQPWTTWTTDGSVPEAIMTLGADDTVTAQDPLSGDELWSVSEMGDTWPAYLLDGILVAVGPTTVTAIDARDGTVLWQVNSEWAANTAAPTDGDVVLVQVSERPGSAILAVDLHTGAEAWRTPGTESGSYWEMVEAGDLFLLVGETEIIGLR